MAEEKAVPSMQLMRHMSPEMRIASEEMMDLLAKASGKLTGIECVTLMMASLSAIVGSLKSAEKDRSMLVDMIAEGVKAQLLDKGLREASKTVPCNGCGKPTLIRPEDACEVVVCTYCAKGRKRKDG